MAITSIHKKTAILDFFWKKMSHFHHRIQWPIMKKTIPIWAIHSVSITVQVHGWWFTVEASLHAILNIRVYDKERWDTNLAYEWRLWISAKSGWISGSTLLSLFSPLWAELEHYASATTGVISSFQPCKISHHRWPDMWWESTASNHTMETQGLLHTGHANMRNSSTSTYDDWQLLIIASNIMYSQIDICLKRSPYREAKLMVFLERW